MGICVCCGKRGVYSCDCRPEGCRGCGCCVGHCRCLLRPLRAATERLAAADAEDGLDDPNGPFAGLPPAGSPGRSAGDCPAPPPRPDLRHRSIQGRADDLLARLDRVTPADGDEMCSLFLERGWVEAVRHLAKGGMLTDAGLAEAAKLLAASDEWADGLSADGPGEGGRPLPNGGGR